MASRILQYILVLFIAVTLNFLLPRVMPGDPIALIAGSAVQQMGEEKIAELRAAYGLDEPLGVQYVRYLGNLLKGDLGQSYRYSGGRSVVEVLADRLGWTLLLVGTSLTLSMLAGSLLGAWAAWRHGKLADIGLLTGLFALRSVPSFWLALILIPIFAIQLKWLPSGDSYSFPWLEGWANVKDIFLHALLPVIVLALAYLPTAFVVMRSTLLGVLGSDYIRTARAKGVREHWVLYKHSLRNALLPVVTAFALDFGQLLGGVVLIETVFNYRGIGVMMFEAVKSRDYPLVQGGFLLFTLGVIAINLLVELLYPALRPAAEGQVMFTPVKRGRGSRRGAWPGLPRRGWPAPLVGWLLLFGLAAMAVTPGTFAAYDPTRIVARPLSRPSPEHPLGTNDIGQDLLSELIWGTRISLTTGLVVAVVAVVVGTGVGILSGYFGGWGGSFLMRLVDLVLVLPFLPLVILLGSYLGPSQRNVVLVLILVSWAGPARMVRAQVLTMLHQPYMEAARTLGSSDLWIMVRHIWPGVRLIVLAQLVLVASLSILAEASLSFLGLGDLSAKSWGSMLYFAWASGAFLGPSWQWWVLPAGMMIALSVMSLVLISVGLEGKETGRRR